MLSCPRNERCLPVRAFHGMGTDLWCLMSAVVTDDRRSLAQLAVRRLSPSDASGARVPLRAPVLRSDPPQLRGPQVSTTRALARQLSFALHR